MKEKAYITCRNFLSGSWKNINCEQMIFESVSGGLSNVLFHCSLPKTHTPLDGEPSQVLLRIYGQLHSDDINKSENKITESLIFMLLSERKIGPKLYGIFPGGRIEEYLSARAMTCKELRDPALSGAIARKLARVHCLDVPINKEPTWLFDTMFKWLEIIKTSANINDVNADCPAIAKKLLSYDFDSEIRWLKNYLSQYKTPVVFSHNDLQEGNILLPNDGQFDGERKVDIDIDSRMILIDFEYCAYNYRPFDFANHFCEWAFDYSNADFPHFHARLEDLPDIHQKRHFTSEYFKANNKPDVIGQDCDIDVFIHQVDAFMLASHMLWTLWAIKNRASSQISFGYWEYGNERLKAYHKHKLHLLREAKFSNESAF